MKLRAPAGVTGPMIQGLANNIPVNSDGTYTSTDFREIEALLNAGFTTMNTVDNDNLTAHAGGGQAAGTPLVVGFNRVTTVASAADSVTLPPAKPNNDITVINAAAANSMNVFPATGEIINALAANAAFAVAANKIVRFICINAGQWYALASA